MLKVQVFDFEEEYDINIAFYCPKCGSKHFVLRHQPKRCRGCDFKFPTIKCMVATESYRVLHHFRKDMGEWSLLC